MRNLIFTFFLGIFVLSLNAQTIIFDPATYGGSLPSGFSIVDIEGTSYLQVVVDGWNSTIDIPEITEVLGTHLTADVKFALGDTSINDGLTLADISSVVQIMDTVHKVPASWDPEQMVPAQTSLSQNPTLDGWNNRKVSITPEMELVHQIQFYGQETTGWSPTVADTFWCGRITSVDASVLFDPATIDTASLPTGAEIVDEGGEKLLKVEVDEWNMNVSIPLYNTNGFNKMTVSIKYDQGTSGVSPDDANCFVKPYGAGGEFAANLNPSTTTLTEVVVDAIMDADVSNIQIAVQNTADGWSAISGAFVYVSKITMSFEEAQQATAPITTTIPFTTESVTVDGLYDDAFDESDVNILNRIALGTVNSIAAAPGAEVDENSENYGEWLACWDADNLYLFIDVLDDDPFDMPSASTTPWENDGIEVFVDIENRRYVGSARITGEQHQFRFNLGTDGPAYGEDSEGNSLGMDAFFGDNDTTNIPFAIITGSLGFSAEIAIPWATILRKSSNTSADALAMVDDSVFAGRKLALELSLIDADAADHRKSIMNWANPTGEDEAYNTNEYWGEVTLTSGSTAIREYKTHESLEIYPNPASDQIYLNFSVVNNVEIYNVLGGMVYKSNNINNVVDISGLATGLYIIKATDNNGRVAVTKFNKE